MDALEREVQAQASWIRRCDDPAALLDRMADYREDLRAGARDGNTRLQMRASELLELAEDRVVALKAARLRAASTPPARADAVRREIAQETACPVRVDPHAAQRAREEQVARTREAAAAEAERGARALAQERQEAERRERARQAAEEEQRAAARLANARAAEVEARVALLQAKAARLTNAEAAAATTATSSVRGRAAGPSRRVAPAAPPVHGPTEPAEDPMEAADRSALMQVARWPPPPARPGDPLWRADAHWPSQWTLTGYDVAIFRGFLNVSQRVLAGQIGVPTVEITRAEARPQDKVRPALQVAVREAMDEAKRARERGMAKAEVVLVARAGEAGVARVEEPASMTVSVATGGEITGADLARWRAAAGLTQQAAADRLGVRQGTVSKAERRVTTLLRPALREALRAAIATP
jgi:hypothetical protein